MEAVYIQFIYGHILFIMAIIIMYVNPKFVLFIKHPYFNSLLPIPSSNDN